MDDLEVLQAKSAPCIERFLASLVEKGFAANTIIAYMKDLEGFNKRLSERGIVLIHAKSIQLMYDLQCLASEGFKPATLSRYFSTARNFFGYLAENHEIARSPLPRSYTRRRHQWDDSRLIAKEDLHAILWVPNLEEAMGYRNYLILKSLMTTDIKPAALVRLTTDDVTGEGKKNLLIKKLGMSRPVEFDAGLLQEMRRFANVFRPSLLGDRVTPALFPASQNESTDFMTRQSVWHILKKSTRAAHLRRGITINDVRQSYLVHYGKTR